MLVTKTGGRSAARFTANAGITPFSVSNSTKIGSLNSDLLDGLDSSAFLRTSGEGSGRQPAGRDRLDRLLRCRE
jgi:hypothetical protein